MVRNVLRSDQMKVKAFHDIKEFGDVSGWAHQHGVAWRKTDANTDTIFEKLHSGQTITEKEKEAME